MHVEIEEEIRKNLILHLSHHGCNACLKPYSDKTIVELDDLTFIFAEKLFYKFDCSVSYNISPIRRNYIFYTENNSRTVYALIKPSLHGNILRYGITCINCWDTKYLEYNMSKLDGCKNYLK